MLDNAWRFSPPNGAITIVARPEGNVVRLAVRDQGPGVPVGERERVFERFYRIGTGLVHDAQGSGLGLAIVRHVAEAHGGRVSVESATGGGARFVIRLPIARAA